VLVLPILRPHDPLPRVTPLLERQFTERQSRGVGGKRPWRCEGTASQPQMGTAPCEVPRAVGSGKSDGRWDGRGRSLRGENGRVGSVGDDGESSPAGRGLISYSTPWSDDDGYLLPLL
jgi:hypothetical protein